MARLLRLLLVALVAALYSPAATRGANTLSYAYDAPAIARVDAQAFWSASAGSMQPSDLREALASPSDEARGTSTTPSARSVAANNGARFTFGSDGVIVDGTRHRLRCSHSALTTGTGQVTYNVTIDRVGKYVSGGVWK